MRFTVPCTFYLLPIAVRVYYTEKPFLLFLFIYLCALAWLFIHSSFPFDFGLSMNIVWAWDQHFDMWIIFTWRWLRMRKDKSTVNWMSCRYLHCQMTHISYLIYIYCDGREIEIFPYFFFLFIVFFLFALANRIFSICYNGTKLNAILHKNTWTREQLWEQNQIICK